MTYNDVKNIVRDCFQLCSWKNDVIRAYLKSTDLPRAAEYAAFCLWMAGISYEENRKTEELRRQLKHLKENGFFDLEE